MQLQKKSYDKVIVTDDGSLLTVSETMCTVVSFSTFL